MQCFLSVLLFASSGQRKTSCENNFKNTKKNKATGNVKQTHKSTKHGLNQLKCCAMRYDMICFDGTINTNYIYGRER